MPDIRQQAFEELKKRKAATEQKQSEADRRAAVLELKERARKKEEADRKAAEDAKPKITEATLISDIKGMLASAIPKLQDQNDLLIKINKAEFDKKNDAEDVIKALNLQTDNLIVALKELEAKPEPKKEWVFKVNRDKAGRITTVHAA